MPAGLFSLPAAPEPGQPIRSPFLKELALGVGRANNIQMPNGMITAAGTYIAGEQGPATPLWLNDSGPTLCPAYGCINLNGEHTDSSRGIPLYVGERPSTYGSQEQHAFNGEYDVDEGAWGEIQQGNEFIARYKPSDFTQLDPIVGEYIGPRSGEWELRRYTEGFEVMSVVDSDTDFLVRVRRKPFVEFRGKASAAINSAATGSVLIHYRSSATAYSSTGVSVTVLNALDQAVAINAWVQCQYAPYLSGTQWVEGWKITQADYTC